MMKRNAIIVFLCSSLFVACTAQDTGNKENEYQYLFKDMPFNMSVIERPVFPDNQLSIADCGGVGDGITLNTDAFNKAMQKLSGQGGGKLTVPFGVWYTGPIVFQSNVNLHLEKGALILFTGDFNAYPLIETSFEGLETRRCQSPISGKNLENIAITGEGSINGAGQYWRPVKKSKVTASHWKNLVASGGVVYQENTWYPSESSLKGATLSETNLNVPRKELTESEWAEIKDFMRPVMISLIGCKNVLLEGVIFENSPSWNIHPLMCENVIIDNIFVRNPAFAQNGDGLDLESCKNAIIVNSIFDVGDDAICIKSGKDEDGRKRNIPTENVIVDNCTVFNGHGGFVVGSEMSGGVKNILVKNCEFLGTDVGLRFKSTRGRGGVVENIYIENISMFDIATEPFLFDLYYGGKSAVESLEENDQTPASEFVPEVNEKTPSFRNIYVKKLVARNARRAMFFNGLPEMNITNINVEDAIITAKIGAELSESDGINFKNVKVVPESGPALILNNVQNFNAENFQYPDNVEEPVRIKGEKSGNIKYK